MALDLAAFVPASARRLARRLRPPHTRCVRFAGEVLPPRGLRYCGPAFRDDAHFLASADAEADRLRRVLDLEGESRLLEVGCGPGRTAIGLLHRRYPIAAYEGVDVDRVSIAWCERFISGRDARFRFRAVDARNERYNPGGRDMREGFSLPYDDGAFDIIYLHSVLSNLVQSDVAVYAREFRRLLRRTGRVFVTAFVEQGVAPVTVNPPDYVMPCEGPLHVVRYERAHLFSIFASAGLEVERFEHRAESGGQSGLYLRPGAPR